MPRRNIEIQYTPFHPHLRRQKMKKWVTWGHSGKYLEQLCEKKSYKIQ